VIPALLVTSSAALLVLAAVSLSWFRSQRCLRGRYRSTVIVTLKTGMAFRGVLFDADAGTLVLRSAQAIADGAAPLTVDGEVLVDRSEVDFLQRP
jgi:hypothetical protein